MLKRRMILFFILGALFIFLTAQDVPVDIDTVFSDHILNDNEDDSDQRSPSIAMSDNGSFVISWQDERNGNSDIYAQCFDTLGNAINSNFKINNSKTFVQQWSPRCAMTGDGYFIVVWRAYEEVYVNSGGVIIHYTLPRIRTQRFDASGSPIDTNVVITLDLESELHQEDFPSVSMSNNGMYNIVWEGTRYIQNVWDDWDIYLQRFDESGSFLDTIIKVNDDNAEDADQLRPDIKIKDDGSFIVAWIDERNENDNYDIYAQNFSSLGIPIGQNYRVSEAGSCSVESPSIAISDDGSYIIVWRDSRNGNDDIYVQGFDSLGHKIGTNIKINDDSGGSLKYTPSADISNNGSYAITWTDNRNGSFDIYAQIYDPLGNAIGNNFPINSLYGDIDKVAMASSVKMFGNKIFTTWCENRFQGKGYDIFYNILEYNILSSISSEDIDHTILNDNYPNPFNPTTTLKYGLPETSDITFDIFDITGRKIKQWSISSQKAGWHELVWDGKDMNGNTVSTGVYIYSLRAGDFVETKKMVLMK
jgi:hypothetical protein